MDKPLPWAHGNARRMDRPSLPPARPRLRQAIAQARSSLEQFSGRPLSERSRVAQHLDLVWQQVLSGLRQAGRQVVSLLVRTRRLVPDRAARPRLAAHLVILLLLAVLVLAGGFRGVLAQPLQANQGGLALIWQQLQPPTTEEEAAFSAYASAPAIPVTIQGPRPGVPSIPEPASAEAAPAGFMLREEEIAYAVQEGDTLGTIAAQFNLSVETLYWYNDLKDANLLTIGQELKIPPTDGLLHTVEEGDTLESIAEEYGVRKGNLIAYAPNNLREPYTLKEGQVVFVPGAAKPIPRPAVSQGYRPAYVRLTAPPYAALPGGERFSWPAMGRITDRFGWTGGRWHTGMDIAAPWGTPIYAAAAGTVTSAGWSGSLGYMVAIDHGEGWVTRYGHMAQQPEVGVGQWVERGQLIGFIGCTGWCTGSHVHFEVKYQGSYTDPLNYLQ